MVVALGLLDFNLSPLGLLDCGAGNSELEDSIIE